MSLTDAFAIIFDTKGADKAQNDINSVTRTVAGTIASFVGFQKIMSTVFDQSEQARELGQLAFSANASAAEIQILGHALKQFGGDNITAANALSNMNKQMTDANFGKQGPLFEAMKIHGFEDIFDANGKMKDSLEVLKILSEKMGKMSKTDALHFGRLAGLDEPTIRLLSLGIEKFNLELERSSKFVVFTEKDVKAGEALYKAFEDVKTVFMQTWNIAIRPMREALKDLFGLVENGLRVLQEYPNLLNTITGASTAIFGIGILNGALKLLSVITGIGTAYKTVSIAVTALASTTGIVIATMIAGFASLGLVIEGIHAKMTGNRGILEEYLKDNSILGENGYIANAITDFFGWNVEKNIKQMNIDTAQELKWGKMNLSDFNDYSHANNILQQPNAPFVKELFGPSAKAEQTFMKDMKDKGVQNINIQTIEIKTNATDAKKISEEIAKSLNDVFGTTVRQFAGSRVV